MELSTGFAFIGQQERFTFNKEHFMVKLPDKNPTIGIVFCFNKSNAIVEMTLPENNSLIFASKYETVFPCKGALQKLLQEKLADADGDANE